MEFPSCSQLEINPWRETETRPSIETLSLKMARPSLRDKLCNPCRLFTGQVKSREVLLSYHVGSLPRSECPDSPTRNLAKNKDVRL